MKHLRRQTRFVSAAMVLALGLAACSGDDAATTQPTTTSTVMSETATGDAMAATAGGPSSAASTLRATLTAALQEHVYLAGIAVVTGVDHGLDSPQFEAAAGALDANSVALSEVIGSVYGQEAADAFLPLWRNHIGFFVDYTAAKATGDDGAAEQARADLEQYRADFGAFLGGANPNLPAEAVAAELVPHVHTLFDAIDAVLGDGTDPFAALRTAAGVMAGTAETLANGIAAQFPERFN